MTISDQGVNIAGHQIDAGEVSTCTCQLIEGLDDDVARRCLALIEQCEMINASTCFHRWPDTTVVN